MGSMFAGFFAVVLIFAVVLALNPLRDAVYNQSCAITQCSSALNLKCINGICQCYSSEFYTDSCKTLSTHAQPCFVDTNCFQTYGLTCRLGTCECKSNYYWNGTFCVYRLNYGVGCSGDQCLPNRGLSCINNKCDCPNTNK